MQSNLLAGNYNLSLSDFEVIGSDFLSVTSEECDVYNKQDTAEIVAYILLSTSWSLRHIAYKTLAGLVVTLVGVAMLAELFDQARKEHGRHSPGLLVYLLVYLCHTST